MATKSLLMFLACTSLIVSCALPDVEINYESRFGMSGILRQGVPLEIYLFQTANPLGGNGFTSPSDYQIIVSRNGQIVDTMERLDSVRFTSWVVPVEDDTIIVEVVDLDSVVISSVPIVVPLPFQFSKKVFWPEIDLEKNTYGSLIVNVERLDEHGDMAMFSVENRRGRGSVTNTFELLNASYCFEGGYSLEDFRSYDFSCKPLRHEINVRSVGTNSIRINDSIKVVLCATDQFSSSYLETTVFENGDIPITKLLFDFDGTTPSNISNSVGAILSINCDTINGY